MTSAPSREGLGLPLHLVSLSTQQTICGGGSDMGGGGNGSMAGGSSVPTLTTPTLTPTTLRNIEQMFMDSDPCLDNGSSSHHANAARFEPPPISLIDLIKVKEEAVPTGGEENLVPPPSSAIPSWIADGSVLPGPHSNIEPLHHPPSSVSFPPTTLIIPNPSSSSSSLSSSLSSSVPHQPSSTPAIPLPILTSSSSSPAPSASTITLPTVPLPVVVQQQPQQQHQSPAASVPASIVVTTHSNNNNSISCLPQPPPLTLTMPSSILPSLPPASVLNGTLQLPLTTQPLLNDVTKLNLLPTEPVGSNSGSGGVKLLSPPSSLTNGVGGAKQSGAAVVGGTSAAVAPPIPTPQRTPLSEETRKALRRQRNKEAAARCRKRRLDQTETLQEEVDRWEALKAETQAEIRSLEDKQRELQELLRAHLSECKVAVRKTISEGEGVS